MFCLPQPGAVTACSMGWTYAPWREDVTCDSWGQYCYVRDLNDLHVWSAGRQPLGGRADEYKAELRPARAAFHRRDGEIETSYEVAVVADENAEVRRVTLNNQGDRPRVLEVTSYAEVALNSRRADQAHPAFAKLFLETEYLHATAGLQRTHAGRARATSNRFGLSMFSQVLRALRSVTSNSRLTVRASSHAGHSPAIQRL